MINKHARYDHGRINNSNLAVRALGDTKGDTGDIGDFFWR